MADTLRAIVDTDKAARIEVQKAKERRSDLTNELAKKKEEIDRQHEINAIKAVEKTKANVKKKIDSLAVKIEKDKEKKSKKLIEHYNENHTEWEDAIFKAVIK
ncbi:MAG: hypothetical protein RSB11_01015 [Oscillospiraceae bacterium]